MLAKKWRSVVERAVTRARRGAALPHEWREFSAEQVTKLPQVFVVYFAFGRHSLVSAKS